MSKFDYPEVTVGALIFDSNGKLFLIKSPKWYNHYVVPGGHIELGESAVNALKREVKEETDLNIDDIKYLSWQEFIFNPHFHVKKHFIFLDFTCHVKNRNARVDKEEATDYIWIEPNEAIKRNDIETYTKNAIRMYLNNTTY